MNEQRIWSASERRCYAMHCKRRMRIGKSCVPHSIVCTIYRVLRPFGYSYDFHFMLMKLVYSHADRHAYEAYKARSKERNG